MPTLDLTADLFFVAAVRAGGDVGGTRLLPLSRLRERLAPHERFSQRVLLALQSMGYIEPELSMSYAEDWLLSRDWLSHGFASLSWRIVRSHSQSAWALENWAEGSDESTPVFECWVNVWEDLALAEVTEYARSLLAQAGYNPEWAEMAENALASALRRFGVLDVMYLIHIALRALALRHQRASTAIGKLSQYLGATIDHYVERAYKERWQIRRAAYPSRPHSAVTAVFAEVVTGLGDRYFTERPCGDVLAEALNSRRTLH